MTPAEAITQLLATRGEGKSICPSEAAKLMAARSGSQWRDHMEDVHEATDALLKAGEISLSWKEEALDQRRGAYRIARR
ncbi:MAG: DUF3253 domain-containing protein [Pseudomonadota bacterium]